MIPPVCNTEKAVQSLRRILIVNQSLWESDLRNSPFFICGANEMNLQKIQIIINAVMCRTGQKGCKTTLFPVDFRGFIRRILTLLFRLQDIYCCSSHVYGQLEVSNRSRINKNPIAILFNLLLQGRSLMSAHV